MMISARIEKIKERFELNNTDLAKVAGVSKQSVTNWVLCEAVPNNKALNNLKRELSVDVEWVLTGRGEMLIKKEDYHSAEFRKMAQYLTKDEKDSIITLVKSLADRRFCK